MTRQAALALAGFTLLAALHLPRLLGRAGRRSPWAQQINFMKNLSIAGGMLMLAAFGPGALSLGARFAPAPARRPHSELPVDTTGSSPACYSAPMELGVARFSLLPWADWAALALFFPAWAGYALFAKQRVGKRPTILAATNRVRRQWMLQTTYREQRGCSTAS